MFFVYFILARPVVGWLIMVNGVYSLLPPISCGQL